MFRRRREGGRKKAEKGGRRGVEKGGGKRVERSGEGWRGVKRGGIISHPGFVIYGSAQFGVEARV